MKTRFSNIGSISVLALLFSSVLIIINSSASAEEPAALNAISKSLDTGQVNAASGSNRFLVWADTTPGKADIFFRRSTDNGATWLPTVNLSNNPGTSHIPQIAVSGSNVYIAWRQLNSDDLLPNIFIRRSTDNGITWSSQVKISTSGTVRFDGAPFQLLASGSSVYAVWLENEHEISFRRSTDSGETWKSKITLGTNGKYNADPQIAVSGSNLYAIWVSNIRNIIFRNSLDNGATWGAKVTLSSGLCPKIAASGSNVYVVSHQSSGGGCGYSPDDILLRRSTDKGVTWKPTVNLSNTPEESRDPQIIASGSNVYVVWADLFVGFGKESEGGEILFRRSTDKGATWKSIVNLSNNPGASTSPEIAVSGSNIYVAWHQLNSEEQFPNIFLKRSSDSGASWAAKINLSNTAQASNPVIAASGSNVYVAWPDSNNGNSDVLFRRSTDNGATWESVKNLTNNSGVSRTPQIGV